MAERGTDETTTGYEQLEAQVQRCLRGRVWHLQLLFCDGGLVLRGRASTYYGKQLAQHAVMQATDLPVRVNEIEVT